MGSLSVWHWLIVAAVVLLLFGYKKLPDASRSLGRSMRIFKSEFDTMKQDDAARDKTPADEPVRPVKPAVIEAEPIRKTDDQLREEIRREEAERRERIREEVRREARTDD